MFLHHLDGENIERKLQEIALLETAHYVAEHMRDASVFKTDFDLLRHSLDMADFAGGGLICEFGVFRGTTINYLAGLTNETIHGFDSFEGLPERWRPNFDKGRFKVSSLPNVKKNVTLHKGWFENTIPPFLESHSGKASFLHVDCDLYSSTKTIFLNFRDRIVPGTVIVFDEFFNYPGWQEGEAKALKEFIEDTGLSYEWIGYCCYHSQAAIIIK